MANITIADDDPHVVELMTMILTQAGHNVSTTASGLEILKKLGIQPENAAAELPDLIITDIMMPKSDGYTVGTLVRNNARTRDIPILVVTALSAMSPLFSETIAVQGVLHKPFRAEELVEKVAQILAGRKASS